MEFFAFGDEVINPVTIPGLISAPLHKANPIRDWLLGRIVMAGICGGVFGICYALNGMNVFPGNRLIWPFALSALAFVVDFVWTAVWLPSNCLKVSAQKKKIFGLLTTMNAVYGSLVSSGPISARNILREVEAAADKGVGWPAPLFALLDDVMSRGTTL